MQTFDMGWSTPNLKVRVSRSMPILYLIWNLHNGLTQYIFRAKQVITQEHNPETGREVNPIMEWTMSKKFQLLLSDTLCFEKKSTERESNSLLDMSQTHWISIRLFDPIEEF